MNDEYLSLTEIGRLYGVSNRQVGKWLKGLGLRDTDGRPSREAFAAGYVGQRPSTQPGTYFYVWDATKTIKLLDGMRTNEPEILGPFCVRSNGGIGQEILDQDGRTIAWTTNAWVAQVIARLLSDHEELLCL